MLDIYNILINYATYPCSTIKYKTIILQLVDYYPSTFTFLYVQNRTNIVTFCRKYIISILTNVKLHT